MYISPLPTLPPLHASTVVPINYLLRRSPFCGALPPDTGQEPSETEVVKALVSHTLEVRIRLPSSASSAQPSSVWYGTRKTSRKKDVGGYEVRRRDWSTLRDRPSRGWTCARWDDMTAYVVRFLASSSNPPYIRSDARNAYHRNTAPSGASLVSPNRSSRHSEIDADADVGPCLRVQCVTLPSHYLDKSGDAPK